MFDFFTKKKMTIQAEDIFTKTAEDCAKEHNYKMVCDDKYRKSIDKSRAFFQADREAQKKAELVNKIGTYTFICPNCGNQCKGEWLYFDSLGNLHGHTGCCICNIHLRV